MFSHAFRYASILCITVTSATAAPLDYDFDVTFDTGALSGQTFTGMFSVEGDDLAATGVTSFTPDGNGDGPSFPSGTLLSFSITIDGTSFEAADNGNFPARPRVAVNDAGTPTLIDFVGDGLGIGYDPRLDPTGNLVTFGGGSSTGEVSDIRSAAVIPLPAALPLLATAIGGIALLRRRG